MNNKHQINIINLNCEGCINTITKALSKKEGVHQVSVDLEKSEVTIDAEDSVSRELLLESLNKMGYPEVGADHNAIHKVKSLYSCATGKLNK
jgi:copper chaperone CopZ